MDVSILIWSRIRKKTERLDHLIFLRIKSISRHALSGLKKNLFIFFCTKAISLINAQLII